MIAGRLFPRPPRVFASAEELPEGSVRGWIFANELFDALPVVRLEGGEDGSPRELRVGVEGERFVWVRGPAEEAHVRHLASFGIALEPGQIAEVAPAAAPLYRRLARALARGSLVTFDYGHRAPALYHPLARAAGTLAVHSAGRRGGDPLARPGEVDLTAHVNWDALARAGEEEGLATRGVFRQGRYLAEAGLLDFVADDSREVARVSPDRSGGNGGGIVGSRSIAVNSQNRSIGRSEIGRSGDLEIW